MPGNTKPHQARTAKRRHARLRKSGTIADMQRELWRAVLCAKDVLLDASGDPATTLKAVHAITSASTAYAKLVEVGELEARLAELEQRLEQRRNGRAYA
jgi:hypothetical protein